MGKLTRLSVRPWQVSRASIQPSWRLPLSANSRAVLQRAHPVPPEMRRISAVPNTRPSATGRLALKANFTLNARKLTDYEPEVTTFFSRIRLVHKLRETRALAGFTRILPPDGSLASDRLQGLKLDQQIDWLPAIKVYGEGIFLEVNPDEITKWAATVPGLRPEFVRLVAHYNAARTARLQPNRNITAKVHPASHTGSCAHQSIEL
jgi:hypothetical protein